MLVYKSAFKWDDGICLGEVLDFPGTVACGDSLGQARTALAEALRDMAETNLLRGEPLPLPDPTRNDPDARHREIPDPLAMVICRQPGIPPR